MRVTYTLTFDEYAEYRMQGNSRTNRRDWVAAGTILVSCALTLGLLSFADSSFLAFLVREPIGTASMIGLMILGGSVPFFVSATQRKEARQKGGLEYAFYSHANTFEFDSEGWSLSCEEGSYRNAWSTLYLTQDLKHVFVLSSRVHGFVLPKRVFTETQLRELQDRAKSVLRGEPPGPLFNVHFRPRWADFVRTTMRHRRRTRFAWLWLLCLYLAGLGMSAFLFKKGFDSREAFFTFYSFLGGILLVATILAEPLTDFFRFLGQAGVKNVSLGVRTDGLFWEQSENHTSFIFKYRRFVKAEETRKLFMLYLSPAYWLILPKKRFTPDQQDQLRRMLRENVGQDKPA